MVPREPCWEDPSGGLLASLGPSTLVEEAGGVIPSEVWVNLGRAAIYSILMTDSVSLPRRRSDDARTLPALPCSQGGRAGGPSLQLSGWAPKLLSRINILGVWNKLDNTRRFFY